MTQPLAPQPLVTEIEAFLERTKMTPTRFGIAAARDPGFVFGVRAGREPRSSTMERVRAFMATYLQSNSGESPSEAGGVEPPPASSLDLAGAAPPRRPLSGGADRSGGEAVPLGISPGAHP